MELKSVLGALSIFEHLRPDEIGRIAARFQRRELAAGERVASEVAQLVVVVRGAVDLEVAQSGTQLRARMTTGDRFGTYALVTGYAHAFAVSAPAPSAIALLDAAGFERVLAEFPAVALPLSREVAAELAERDDVVRQLLELHAAGLPDAELQAAVDRRRAAQQRHGARVTRSSTRGLFRRFVI